MIYGLKAAKNDERWNMEAALGGRCIKPIIIDESWRRNHFRINRQRYPFSRATPSGD